MNIHKNARTTPQSRALLVHRVLQEHWPVSAVAMAFGVSERTVYKWLARYRAKAARGCTIAARLAHRRPHALAPAWLALIRAAAASQAGGGRDRCPAAAGALDGERRADAAGLGPPALPESAAAGATLRVAAARRAGAPGHQETRPHRATRPSRHRQPARLGRGRRLGICARRHRRLLALHLCRDPARREALHRHPASGCARCASSAATASASNAC